MRPDLGHAHILRILEVAGCAGRLSARWSSSFNQPRPVQLDGELLRVIRTEAYGGTEVAPALLAKLQRLTMASLYVEVPESDVL
jgi:hypothetical protein